MSNLTNTFTNIADAIRAKTGSSETMTPAEMPTEIANIPSESTLIEKTINTNGTYNAEDDGVDGYNNITVNVPTPSNALFKSSLTGLPSPIATFTGADAPLDSLKASIEGVQDLHGYDGPWPAGGGKNKLQVTANSATVNGVTFTVNSDGTVATSGTASANATFNLNTFDFKAGESYILNGCPTGGSLDSYLLSINGVGYDSGRGYTYNPQSDITGIIRIVVYSGTNMNGKEFKPMIRLASVQDATFAPYSNICPISGWSEANVARTGKNLLDPLELILFKNNTYIATKDYSSRGAITVKPLTTYTLSLKTVSVGGSDGRVYGFNANGETTQLSDSFTNKTTFITPADCTSIYFRAKIDAVENVEDVNPMLELGNTATTYEPYNGTTTTIPFTDEQGQSVTVYGGSVDVVNGTSGNKLTHVFVEYDGSDDEIWQIALQDATAKIIGSAPGSKMGTTSVISNYFESPSTNPWSVKNSIWTRYSQLHVNPDSSIIPSGITQEGLAEWRTWLSTHPLQVRYELATPTTFYTQPTSIKSLDGENNVFVDCGEVTECKYFSETILYNANNLQIANTSTYITANLNVALEVGKTYIGIIKDYGDWSNVPIIFTRVSGNQSITVSLAQGSGTLVFTNNTVTLDPYAGDYRNIYLTLREYII